MDTNQSKATEILYKKLSYKVVGCLYKIYNTLGPGHKEDIYQKAIRIEFDNNKIECLAKKKLVIEYDGQKIGIYEPDFIIEDKIILEIKSVLTMPKVFEKQLYYYLRASGYKLGYLVNFGTDKIDIRRRII